MLERHERDKKEKAVSMLEKALLQTSVLDGGIPRRFVARCQAG